MRNPLETVTGRICGYDREKGELLIRAPYRDRAMLEKRNYTFCEITLMDGRPLSSRQRRSIYALLREIADYTGQNIGQVKETLKRKFLDEDRGRPDLDTFSLSDCSMSLACSFQKYLVRFMLDFEVPSKVPLLEFADDVPDYIYACLVTKHCCICGKHADLHHCAGSTVGAGVDRTKISHLGLEALPLCREHHTECHTIGQQSFNERYHIPGGIRLDADLCRLYGLRGYKEEN